MTDEEKKREAAVEQLVRDYKYTFGSPDGKRVVEDLKKRCSYDFVKVPVDGNGRIDSHQVMKNEGERSVIVHILTKLKTNLDKPKQTEAISKE